MKDIKRRTFLTTTAATAAFTIVPRHVLGRGYKAPSDTLNIAGIGVGGQGGADLRDPAIAAENIVALADADWRCAQDSFEKYPNAERYKDWRKMLDTRKDIDAVIVATPDHSHAVATMAALKLGYHVYCEKPLTYTIKEARLVAEEAKRQGVATQLGTQGHAMEEARLLCEWIWDGAIGDVTEVHAWTPHPVWPQGMDKPIEKPPVPDEVDWDVWLGPAPYRDYHPDYMPMLWRGWWDFGTGGLGDMGCHIFDPIVWALKLGQPTSVQGRASIFVREPLNWDKVRNTESYPCASMVYYDFPAREGMPSVKLTWYDGGLMPETPIELEAGRKMGDQFGGVLYVGTKGKILTGSHGARGVRIIPEPAMRAYERPAKTLERSIGHREEWVQACKGGPKPGINFEKAGPLTEIVLLGNLALRTDDRLFWDAEKLEITNKPEFNQYLHREYREGWSL